MDRYLSGEEIDYKTLVGDLERAVARGVFHPVLAAAPAAQGARQGIGTVELLELITGGFPTPLERAAPVVTTPSGDARTVNVCDPDGPLVAEVVKTASDPYVGRISLVRVFSGTLRPDDTVHVSGHGLADRGHEDHDVDERIGALSSPFGKQQRVLSHCIAGDLACVAKLGRAETGDTLSAKDDPLLMEPWDMPDPLLPLAIQAHSKPDEDKLSQGLSRLVAEDPTMRLEQNQDTHQVVLWCLGEAHADVALERLRNRYGVQVDVVPHKVSLQGDVRRQVGGPRAPCEAVRRARTVRDLRDRGGAAAERLRHRVRGQGRRRRGAAAVHPVRGEGRTGAGREGRGRGLSPHRRADHAARRQGALGGLLRRGVPDGGRAGTAGGGRGREDPSPGAGRRGAGARRRRLRGRGDERSVGAARPRGRHGTGSRGLARSCGPRSRRSRSAGTRWTCGRCRTARGGSAGRTRGTSRCPRSWATGCANRPRTSRSWPSRGHPTARPPARSPSGRAASAVP